MKEDTMDMQALEATPTAAPEQARLDAFMGKMLGDMGAAMTGSLVLVGDRLGLYRAMADGRPVGPQELARRTGTNARMVQEWLAAQAASGYVTYEPRTSKYVLEPEQAMVFADENGPAFLAGAYDVVASAYRDADKVAGAFKSGRGLGWHEHDQCLFRGTERFFRTSYNHHLVPEWLPALDGVLEKLQAGARVADVGCGHGASTVIMAKAFPNSQFIGYDYHEPSLVRARQAAEQAGLAGRVVFERAAAKDYPGQGFDLVCFFDCLHDMGDPVGAAAHVRTTLKPDGTWMVVEPFACHTLEANMNPIGRLYYASSTMVCTPASMSQEVGLALGAQAGEARLTEVIESGGFGRVRVAMTSPFNLILEARC
jgi:SAM-dependent methyltransferase